MGRIKRKRIRWQPSFGPDLLKYRIYWAQGGDLSYDSDHADLGPVLEVILPDDIPVFPLVAGEMSLGITAINAAGNESDMTKTSVYLDCTVPDAPLNVIVEDVD